MVFPISDSNFSKFITFPIFSHNAKIVSRLRNPDLGSQESAKPILPTQQFGASLEWIRQHQPDGGYNGIPPIMLKCIDFLSRPDCLETEGIFRRSANAALVKELQVCRVAHFCSNLSYIYFYVDF
jgi:Rho GTPase-activating protein 1